MSPPAELVERIKQGQRFVLASHQRPDGDAIGSAMAMALALKSIGKDATVVTDAIPPAFLQPFPGVDTVRATPDMTEGDDAATMTERSERWRTVVDGLDRTPRGNSA